MPPEGYYNRKFDFYYWMINPTNEKTPGKSNHKRKSAQDQVFEIESKKICRALITEVMKNLN